ncbi:hypothetical protein DSL72_002089 [Monilinia vaccinii-corymbosi]|uniref:Uncharacterized protein n=1 Tax=Monilinia vaccinii-corymbosi TaxID=61207 RepID=A0A8A3PBN2_9HELO|nr:hypothetical protein DSL72_002089 [Monilinia vaccinii-corymbosi]
MFRTLSPFPLSGEVLAPPNAVPVMILREQFSAETLSTWEVGTGGQPCVGAYDYIVFGCRDLEPVPVPVPVPVLSPQSQGIITDSKDGTRDYESLRRGSPPDADGDRSGLGNRLCDMACDTACDMAERSSE